MDGLARVLILSSFVAAGHVGLSAGQPVLQALGHCVTPLPTVLLSNHPGFAAVSGETVAVPTLHGMVDALDRNGWLGRHDAVQTGYLPTPGHVDLACALVDRMRAARPGLRVVVDPVMGDAPKGLYLAPDAAKRLRDRLAGRADVLVPNAWEAEWLGPVAVPRVVVTSAIRAGRFGVSETGGGVDRHYPVARLDGVPHGTGDVFAALLAAGLTVAQALGHLQALIAASLGQEHLAIVQSLPDWTRAAPLEEENGL